MLELARFSALLGTQDGAKCGKKWERYHQNKYHQYSWDYHIFKTLYRMRNLSLLEVGKMMGCCWVGGFLVVNNVKLLVHLASWNLSDFKQKVIG